jgi:hypothetical protein
MQNAFTGTRLILFVLCAVIAICASQRQALAQQNADDGYDGSRQIGGGFAKARPTPPADSKPASAPVYKRVDTAAWNAAPEPKVVAPPARTRNVIHHHVATTRRKPLIRMAESSTVPPSAAEGEFADVGVTIWRLRPGKLSDDAATMAFLTADGLEQLVTPVRIKGTDSVSLGDRLRFSIESPRTGYLYVINRTKYDDGSIGTPELIYPTLRTRGGDNRVTAGRLIDVPAQDDTPNYFTLTSEGHAERKVAGEILDVIVSPSPITELSSVRREALQLSAERVAQWSRLWGNLAEQLELVGGEGQPWTNAEKEAGANGGRSLTQVEPMPQTIYRVKVRRNGPAMVTLQLIYGQQKATKKNG